MAWKVEYTDIAERTIEKLDLQVRRRINSFFRERVANVEDPVTIAEPLQGEFRGLWRFRIGDYRAICDIRRKYLLVLVLDIGHRKEIYR
ncbi:MAG: type II toxin-antitoxin system RelE family toxin [Acidobacteriaceae bacterium]